MKNSKLTFLRDTGNKSSYGGKICLYKCDCGNTKEANEREVKRGNVRSCGCLNSTQGGLTAKHRLTYNSYSAMRARCLNKKDKDYYKYGAAGIGVCERWRKSFENFLDDMGERPGPEYSIDRIDGTKSYCPSNCRWATITEQIKNRRSSRIYKGETATEASRRLGGCDDLVLNRLRLGWSLDKAFTMKPHQTRKNTGQEQVKNGK